MQKKVIVIGVVIMVAVVAGLAYLYRADQNRLGIQHPKPLTEEEAKQAIKGIPLSFQENKGQTDAQVKYLVRQSGLSVFFTDTAVVYTYSQTPPSSDEPKDPIGKPEQSAPTKSLAIRQTFEGANQGVTINTGEPLTGKVNYFIGNDPDKWIKEVRTFGTITYSKLYSGIDATFRGDGGQIHTDYTLDAGVDPAIIAVHLEGIDALRIDEAGNIVLATAFGDIAAKAPSAYQMIDGEKKELPVQYRLIDKQQYGFVLPAFDRSLPVVISQ